MICLARSGNYDDLNNTRDSKGERSSSKVILAVIILSVIISIIAVLVWIKILETQDVVKQGQTAASENTSSETVPLREYENPSKSELKAPEVSSGLALPSLEEGLSVLTSSAASATGVDYISSLDYGLPENAGADVTEESVEMKKPQIADRLSISQQPSFSKDIVRYREYIIREGDSLVSIANDFGLSLQTLISVNRLTSAASLWIGSPLRIPDRDGALYVVREGDSLLSITQQYGLGISAKTLGNVNGIHEDSLQVGQELFIPYETIETSGTITAESGLSFSEPAESTVVGMYNQKVLNPLNNDSMRLDGILLQAQPETPVFASEAGTVVDIGFNDDGSGFVKIMHTDGYTTEYDYLSDICVKTADIVEKGQRIGSFGPVNANYGNPVVFFRIRQEGVPFDPLSFL